MTSLDEHNRIAIKRWSIGGEACLNGIECPQCGSELWDTSPNESLTSYPPQKRIHCKTCGWGGFRIE